MINSKELRIGGIFYWNGEILPSREIIFHPDKNEIVELSGFILGHMLAYYPGKDFENIPLDPIPLTPEILTDWCGMKVLSDTEDDKEYEITIFRQTYRVVLSQGTDWLLLWEEDVGCGFESLRFIDHLHELQNLVYFTNSIYQELEIKIPQKA